MEYYSKCNICGKITCYTDEDLKKNNSQSLVAGLAAISTIGNAVAGTRYDMYESSKLSDRASSKIVDYSKCPNCGSTDIILVTKKFAIFSNKVNNTYSIDNLLDEAKSCLDKNDFENAFCFATIALNEDDKNYDAYLIRFLSSYGIKNLEELNKVNLDYNNQHFKNLLKYSDNNQKEKLLNQYKNLREKSLILDANFLLKSKNSEDLMNKIESIIKEIEKSDIADKTIIEDLRKKKLETIYSIACNKLNENTRASVNKAKELFETIKGYKDVNDKINLCNNILKNVKSNTRKKIIIISITIIILIFIIVILNIINTPIQMSKVENFINEEKYKEAYEILININKDSDKKNIYLNEILEHGRYVIKSVKGTNEDTTINYEYNEKGNPKKIVEEYYYKNNTKFKNEYLFNYDYADNGISKMVINLNTYVSDRKEAASSETYEYSFYNKKFDYEFTINTSYDSPKYSDFRTLTLVNYIYIKNIKSINENYNLNKSKIIEFDRDGLDKDSTINNINSNVMEFKSDNWDWSSDLVKLTLDNNGLITECKNIEDDKVDYAITRKYKNGLIVNATQVRDSGNDIFEYVYDSHHNFTKIKEDYNLNLAGGADDVREFEWEWIDY